MTLIDYFKQRYAALANRAAEAAKAGRVRQARLLSGQAAKAEVRLRTAEDRAEKLRGAFVNGCARAARREAEGDAFAAGLARGFACSVERELRALGGWPPGWTGVDE